MPHHRISELIGLRVIYVDDPDRLASAWNEALASDRPVEVKTDPEVPPLPPHITLKQAKNFMATIAAPDPNESGMLIGTAKEVLSGIAPGMPTLGNYGS